MTERIRLLIADDHPVVRVGLRGMLAEQPDLEVVAEAQTGKQAVELVERHFPRVVLMDLRMPEMDGVEATTRILTRRPEVSVLILTTYESDSDILRAIKTGATGYLLKDAPREELFAAIRSAAQGKPPLSPAVAARLIERVRTPPEKVLSAREIEVLELVAQGKSNPEIAGKLWISETTVKSHMIRIFEKLDVTDRTAAVTVALRRRILRLEP